VKRKLTDTVKPVTGQLDKALKDVTGAVGGLLGDGTKGTGLLGGLTGSARDGSAAPAGGTDAGKILNYLLGP
jgi:hypothetical protein